MDKAVRGGSLQDTNTEPERMRMKFQDFDKLFNAENAAAETPAYVFNVDELKSRIAMIRSNLPGDFRLVFAVKANPFLTGALIPCVDAFEICSPGEERICERAAVPPEKMVLSGVNKEAADFCRIMAYCGRKAVYTVESLSQMQLLNETAGAVLRAQDGAELSGAGMTGRKAEAGMAGAGTPGKASSDGTIEVLLRVTSGNQFGLDEEDIETLVRDRAQYPNLTIRGLQLYSGTQKKKEKFFEDEIAKIDILIGRLKENYDFTVREFEYGPGLFVPYFLKEGEADDAGVLRKLSAVLRGMSFQGTVTLEMGRFISAYCGYYVTRIADIKKNCGISYCILDGGIHQVNYFGQMMAMKMPYILHSCAKNGEESENFNLCGSLCTVSDVIVKEVPLHSPHTGDILVFERTGAYSVTEGISLFLSRDLPCVYLFENEELKQIRKRILTEEWNYG